MYRTQLPFVAGVIQGSDFKKMQMKLLPSLLEIPEAPRMVPRIWFNETSQLQLSQRRRMTLSIILVIVSNVASGLCLHVANVES